MNLFPMALPEGGLNIRLVDTPAAMKRVCLITRSLRPKLLHGLTGWTNALGAKGAKIGIVAAGKNWLDVTHAMLR